MLVSQMVDDKLEAEFDYQANNAQLATQARVHSYMDVLRGTSALFYTSGRITRKQFHDYVSQLQLESSFPGITNLNFASAVSASERAAFEAAVRGDRSIAANGYPDFAIKPAGDRPAYHVVTYIEPMETNRVSFGFDIASRDRAPEALDFARDNGQLISSGRLIQIDGPHRHVGLAMRIPLYRPDMPLDTVAQRRAAYYGSVGAGYNVSKLLLGAMDKKSLPHMKMRIYDVGLAAGEQEPGTHDPGHLLFDSETPDSIGTAAPLQASDTMFVKRVAMTVGPRLWEAEFSAEKRALLKGVDAYLPWLMLVAGLLTSGMLYGVYYSLISARRRAVELAQEMTKDLRDSEASLAEAQHMARLGSWHFVPATQRMSWSPETFQLLGLERHSIVPAWNNYLERIHKDDRSRIRAALERALESGEEFSTEHRIARQDGTIRWVKAVIRPGSKDGRAILRGTIMDITELKQTLDALKRSQELLRELTAHQDRVKEEERRRIAREIHDELGQTLLALRIDVSMLEARTGQSHPRLNKKVRDALQHIDATVKTIRTIINNLRPAVLDLGLTAAIEWQVAEFRRRSGISCDLEMGPEELAVDDACATTLFRILQESLTNVIRHANATYVLIELYQEDRQLVMRIRDNGIGIYPKSRKPSNSFGLVGVEERVHALHGAFRIDSAPGKGTTLTIYIPMESAARELEPVNVR